MLLNAHERSQRYRLLSAKDKIRLRLYRAHCWKTGTKLPCGFQHRWITRSLIGSSTHRIEEKKKNSNGSFKWTSLKKPAVLVKATQCIRLLVPLTWTGIYFLTPVPSVSHLPSASCLETRMSTHISCPKRNQFIWDDREPPRTLQALDNSRSLGVSAAILPVYFRNCPSINQAASRDPAGNTALLSGESSASALLVCKGAPLSELSECTVGDREGL